MKELEKFFRDVERIADALETISSKNNFIPDENPKSENVNEKKDISTMMPIKMQNPEVVQTPVNTQPPTAIPTPVNVQSPVTIPTTQQVESFTQDQIAKAMANAMQAGKHSLVQTILNTFNAQCLMEIDKSNYNKIATMLREAGIQI